MWITERRDVVSGVFYLLTVLAYLAAVGRRAAGRGLGGFYWTSLGCFVLAVLSKSMVVSLPVVLLILDVYPLRRLGGRAGWTGAAARRVLAEKIPFLLVAAAGAAVGVFGQAGDLFESLVKRAAGVKDSGTILPGHGGILDRADAILAAGPVLHLFAAWSSLAGAGA